MSRTATDRVRMSVSRYFASNRLEARAQFIDACDALNLDFSSYYAPKDVDDSGEPIIDVARVGPHKAPVVLALTNGSWVDEGLCASGIQTALLREGLGRIGRNDIALVLVHAIAPAGLSGLGNRGPAISDTSIREWSNHALAAAENRFASYVQETHTPKQGSGGIPWQARVLCEIADAYFARAQSISLIDLRTGPGFYGEADLLACRTHSDPRMQRATQLFGTAADTAEPTPHGTPGDLAHGLITALERSDLTAAVLEFGTYSMRSVLSAGSGSVFYPDTTDWREQAWASAQGVIQHVLLSLPKSGPR